MQANDEALLRSEIEQIRHDLNLLLEKTPTTSSPWLGPKDFAQQVGVSVETLRRWRKEGRFRPHSIRSIKAGQRTDWQFHRLTAIEDANKAT